jgi:hypothetical protein
MSPYRLGRLTTLALLAAAFALPASAAAGPQQIGPPPVKGDCYTLFGTHETPKCFYGVEAIDFSNSPHLLRIGETMTVSMTHGWDSFNGFEGNFFVRRVYADLNLGDFEVIGEPCQGDFYYSGSATCTLKAKQTTNGWRHHGYRLVFGGSYSYRAGDYYAIIGDGYEIAGEITTLDLVDGVTPKPAKNVGVTVTKISGEGDPAGTEVPTVTNDNGRYSVLVDKGVWKVSTDLDTLCKSPVSGTSCDRAPQVTTPGNRTVDFAERAPATITGTVTSRDGAGIEGVTVRAQPDGGRLRIATTDKAGLYELKVPPGLVTMDTPDKLICPKPLKPDNTCGEHAKTITVTTKATVDFAKPGCVKTIDFGTSMVAKAECFEPIDESSWKTEKPFRMNGLDFEPAGKVTFDKQQQTVNFEGGPLNTIGLPAGGERYIIGAIPAMSMSFRNPTQTLSLAAGVDRRMPSIGKFPIAGSVKFDVPAGGTTVITGTLALPKHPEQQFQPLTGAFADPESLDKEIKRPSSPLSGISFSVTTDNDNGARGLEGSVSGKVELTKARPLVTMSQVRLGYDYPTKTWILGAKGTLDFLKPPGVFQIPEAAQGLTGSSSAGFAAPELTTTVQVTGIPTLGGAFGKLNVTASPINRPINPSFWLQRIALDLGVDALKPGAPFSAKVGVGMSFGPRNPSPVTKSYQPFGSIVLLPAELASLDGDASVGWARPDMADLVLAGNLNLKVWDQTVGTGNITLYPEASLIGGSATLTFKDPAGGKIFLLSGKGELWWDGVNNKFFQGGNGVLSITGIGSYRGEYAITDSGFGYCESTGAKDSWGIFWDRTTGDYGEAKGCDLSRFTSSKPKPPAPVAAPARAAAAAVAKANRFTLRGDERLVAVRVPGKAKGKGPKVTLRGPGVKLTSDPLKASGKGGKVALTDAADGTVTFVIESPRAGDYRIEPAKGEKIGKPSFAQALPPAQVDGELTGGGCKPVLRWTAGKIAGQKLRFVERTERGTRVVGESSKTKGSLAITPLPGGGRVEVSVQVLNGESVRDTIVLASYASGADLVLPGPQGLTVKRGKKKGATAKWSAVCGAAAYAVQVGKGKAQVVRGTSLKIAKWPRRGQAVTVTSLGASGASGGSARRAASAAR